MTEATKSNRKNEHEKEKWLRILDTIPFFVMIYDRIENDFTYKN